METLYDYQERVKTVEKKEYLRKGSSINKSILNNIVRLKLSRVNEDGRPPEEFIGNDEIISMIKLYKGTQTVSKEETERVQTPIRHHRKDKN